MAQPVINQLSLKIANLTRELKHHIEEKYELMDANNKLREQLKQLEDTRDFYHELAEEKYEIEEELEEVKQERDKLKRDKEIQKLGGLKLCYKN